VSWKPRRKTCGHNGHWSTDADEVVEEEEEAASGGNETEVGAEWRCDEADWEEDEEEEEEEEEEGEGEAVATEATEAAAAAAESAAAAAAAESAAAAAAAASATTERAGTDLRVVVLAVVLAVASRDATCFLTATSVASLLSFSADDARALAARMAGSNRDRFFASGSENDESGAARLDMVELK
jgi:hypothetical protein